MTAFPLHPYRRFGQHPTLTWPSQFYCQGHPFAEPSLGLHLLATTPSLEVAIEQSVLEIVLLDAQLDYYVNHSDPVLTPGREPWAR
jgi:hypothetical protein